MQKREILEKTDISPSKRYPLEKHKVKLANGKVVDDYFVSPMGNVVIIFPITKDNEVILVKQYRHGIEEIMIELPGGFEQKGKTLEESALAELEEETGIKTTKENIKFIGKIANSPSKGNMIAYHYFTQNLEFNSIQNFDETEDIELIKVKPKKLLEMVENGKIWTANAVSIIYKVLAKYPEIFED